MKQRTPRRSDSGTITIMAIVLLTTLMGMAGLAIDVGFLYTRSRMLYAVADSAVYVGMKDLAAGKSSAQISTDVSDMAAQYSGYTISLTPAPTATTVTVKVVATYPLFFAKMIGFPSKTMTVITAGTLPASPPPILALGLTCATGVSITGQGALAINGSIESNGSTSFTTGSPGPIVNGNVTAGCGPVTLGPGMSATGSVGVGGPFTDPFSPYVLPACTAGSSTTTTLPWIGAPNPTYWNMATTPPTLLPGVYCSNANIILTDPGAGFNATGVTFISIGGTISIQVSAASTITPNPASPNGIIAYSTANTGTAPGDIAVTGPGGALVPGLDLNIGGSFYAPNGTVNIQQNDDFVMTGSIIANNVWIADNNAWSIGTGAGGGGGIWQMSQ